MKLLYLILTLLACYPSFASAPTPAEQPSVAVTSIPVQQGSLPQLVIGYGTVEPAANSSININRLRAGKVTKLYVTLGQQVQKGTALLDFASDPVANLDYNKAVSALAAAKQQQSRIQQLLAQQLATRLQVAQADQAAADAEAALKAAKQQGADKKTEKITAPFDGVVAAINANAGDTVAANTLLLQLTRGNGLVVSFGVPLGHHSDLQIGQAVQLIPLDNDKVMLPGKVTAVASMLDPKTRLVNVMAAVTGATPDKLFPGAQFMAQVEINRLSGVIVPRQAVQQDEQGSYIFQITQNKAVRVPVTIAGEAGGQYAVGGEIDPNKKIITTGNYQLADGDLVRETVADSKTEQAVP